MVEYYAREYSGAFRSSLFLGEKVESSVCFKRREDSPSCRTGTARKELLDGGLCLLLLVRAAVAALLLSVLLL